MTRLILTLILCLSISSGHAAKLVGTFIFSVEEVQEVIGFSNAIFFPPSSINHLEEFLVEIDSRVTAVPELNRFLSENGTFRYQDLKPIVDAVQRAGHTGKIVFMLDEPFWRIRLLCAEGNMTSCAEIDDGYINVIEGYRRVVSELKEILDDVEVIHIESFAELYYQKVETGRLILIDSAHYFSFDCYGKFDSCGIDGMDIPFLSQAVYGRILFDAIQDLGTDARMVLIPGGFQHHTFFPTEQDVIRQLEKYFEIYDSTDIFGGIVPFVWSSLSNDEDFLIGARYLPDVRKYLTENLGIRKFNGIVPFVSSNQSNDENFLVGSRYLPDVRRSLTNNLDLREFSGIVPFVSRNLSNDEDFLIGARYLPDVTKYLTDNLGMQK